jgi:hypothetical protein
MLQIERFNSLQIAIEQALKGFQANLWTALPCIVQSYNAAKGTVSVQPAIRLWVTTLNGANGWLTIPPLVDIPVCYMGGGGFVTTYPIQAGDEALVIFASRCIDSWWQQGGVQNQFELRSHDISDGFALIGPRSQANLIPNVSTTSAQFRSLDGSTYVEIAGGQVVNIHAPSGVNITGSLSVNGDVSITGKATATGEVQGAGIKLSVHKHISAASGSPTGPPLP